MLLFVESLLYKLRTRFMIRWIVANVIGWTVGLYAGVLNPVCFGGTGIIAGLVLGAAQWWALQGSGLLRDQSVRKWITMTFTGSAIGLIPAALIGAAIFLFANGFAAFLAGAILGGAVGVGQWVVLRRVSPRAVLWLSVNAVGGAVCGLLTIVPIIRGLPVGLLLGTMIFGYATGRILELIIQES